MVRGAESLRLTSIHSTAGKHDNKEIINKTRRCKPEYHGGPIPDGIFGIFHCHNPPGSTMTPGSTQPLTEMSTRNTSWWGKGGRCVGMIT